jgi:hypothetical protein
MTCSAVCACQHAGNHSYSYRLQTAALQRELGLLGLVLVPAEAAITRATGCVASTSTMHDVLCSYGSACTATVIAFGLQIRATSLTLGGRNCAC